MTFKDKLKHKNVVVTGATGFIGGQVVSALRQSGANITVILRSKHGRDRFLKDGMGVITTGLSDQQVLQETLQDADVLFNLAYDVRASGPDNLSAFKVLLDTAQKAQVKRIVHTSSIVVYDDWPSGDLDEHSTISTPSGGAYRQAKIEMERMLEASGMPTAILQPTLVYGPNSALWTDKVLNQLNAGPVILPDQDGLCNAVYVDDVAQAALRAAIVDDLGCERFIISGAQPISWHAFCKGYQGLVSGSEIRLKPEQELRDRLGPVSDQPATNGGPSIAARISAQLRALIGKERFEAVMRMVARLRSKRKPTYPNRGGLELMTATGTCDISNASKRLGYTPEYDFEAGLAQIAKSKNLT